MKCAVQSMHNAIGLELILIAGLCGGLVEVAWATAYSCLTTITAAQIGREITRSVFPELASLPAAPMLGLVIHLVLSAALGFVFARVVWIPVTRRLHPAISMIGAVAVLGVIWALSFFVVLPALNPAFVTLMPYPATFVSKALFGIAMAWVLQVRCAGQADSLNQDRG